MKESVEKILMNKTTGHLGLGIRVSFYDKFQREETNGLPGYSLIIAKAGFDGWLIYSGGEAECKEGDGPWVYAPEKLIQKICEVIG